MPDPLHRRYLRQLRSRWGFLIICMLLMLVALLAFRAQVPGLG